MPSPRVRLVEGAHIVVPKLFDHDRAYLLQHPDGRVVFAIPYERNLTLIGTTDHDHQGNLNDPKASADEISYLCDTASSVFSTRVQPDEVVWTYSGVRPLIGDSNADAKAVSRDYRLDVDASGGQPPLLSIIGGKITTYRKLAEAALEKLAAHLPSREGLAAGWTGVTALPGGDFSPTEAEALVSALRADFPFLDRLHAVRLVGAYGTTAWSILGQAKSMADLGTTFGANLTGVEVRHLIREEWAKTAEDVVWRRSKAGLHMASGEVEALDTWMRKAVAGAAVY
jgi:glycerol-3-phosphate dehydrogenase